MTELEQPVAADDATIESEVVEQTTTPGAADTPETTEAETDEQKNEREVQEQKQRSDRRARGVQKRLDELTADKYAEREARQRAERETEWLRQQLTGRPDQQQQQKGSDEPKRENFTDYEQFMEARAEYRAIKVVEERLGKAEAEAYKRAAAADAQTQAAKLVASLQEKQEVFAKTKTDYFDVVNNHDIHIPDAAAIAIMRHKDSPALMYHIGRNPGIADSLGRLDPMAQAIAVGELAAALRQSPQMSKAPPPGTPTGSRSGSSKDPSSMTRDQYYDFITKGGKK